MKNTIALITGASSGIGYATAVCFAENGIDIIVCGRRMERLENLWKEYENKVNVLPLAFDITNPAEVKNAIATLPKEWKNIDILVNNAGNAHGLAPIHEGDIADWEAMIDTNVKGLLYVSRAVIPNMVKRKAGHVVNLGSIAGTESYAQGNVYCASKHAVAALSEAMRIDLHAHGIRVSEVKPGLVETEFSLVRFKGDADLAAKTYEGYEPLQAQDIAELIYFIVTRPARVNIADALILPAAQAKSKIVHKENKK
ncbi:MAG: SDR family NAD(P)-dependent oxidoreductase [Bernardetiaceae bacterium]|nr:SDR family NAD(P)-dependent oxidoreductase [Bernardetiaceae bacterium]